MTKPAIVDKNYFDERKAQLEMQIREIGDAAYSKEIEINIFENNLAQEMMQKDDLMYNIIDNQNSLLQNQRSYAKGREQLNALYAKKREYNQKEQELREELAKLQEEEQKFVRSMFEEAEKSRNQEINALNVPETTDATQSEYIQQEVATPRSWVYPQLDVIDPPEVMIGEMDVPDNLGCEKGIDEEYIVPNKPRYTVPCVVKDGNQTPLQEFETSPNTVDWTYVTNKPGNYPPCAMRHDVVKKQNCPALKQFVRLVTKGAFVNEDFHIATQLAANVSYPHHFDFLLRIRGITLTCIADTTQNNNHNNGELEELSTAVARQESFIAKLIDMHNNKTKLRIVSIEEGSEGTNYVRLNLEEKEQEFKFYVIANFNDFYLFPEEYTQPEATNNLPVFFGNPTEPEISPHSTRINGDAIVLVKPNKTEQNVDDILGKLSELSADTVHLRGKFCSNSLRLYNGKDDIVYYNAYIDILDGEDKKETIQVYFDADKLRETMVNVSIVKSDARNYDAERVLVEYVNMGHEFTVRVVNIDEVNKQAKLLIYIHAVDQKFRGVGFEATVNTKDYPVNKWLNEHEDNEDNLTDEERRILVSGKVVDYIRGELEEQTKLFAADLLTTPQPEENNSTQDVIQRDVPVLGSEVLDEYVQRSQNTKPLDKRAIKNTLQGQISDFYGSSTDNGKTSLQFRIDHDQREPEIIYGELVVNKTQSIRVEFDAKKIFDSISDKELYPTLESVLQFLKERVNSNLRIYSIHTIDGSSVVSIDASLLNTNYPNIHFTAHTFALCETFLKFHPEILFKVLNNAPAYHFSDNSLGCCKNVHNPLSNLSYAAVINPHDESDDIYIRIDASKLDSDMVEYGLVPPTASSDEKYNYLEKLVDSGYVILVEFKNLTDDNTSVELEISVPSCLRGMKIHAVADLKSLIMFFFKLSGIALPECVKPEDKQEEVEDKTTESKVESIGTFFTGFGGDLKPVSSPNTFKLSALSKEETDHATGMDFYPIVIGIENEGREVPVKTIPGRIDIKDTLLNSRHLQLLKSDLYQYLYNNSDKTLDLLSMEWGNEKAKSVFNLNGLRVTCYLDVDKVMGAYIAQNPFAVLNYMNDGVSCKFLPGSLLSYFVDETNMKGQKFYFYADVSKGNVTQQISVHCDVEKLRKQMLSVGLINHEHNTDDIYRILDEYVSNGHVNQIHYSSLTEDGKNVNVHVYIPAIDQRLRGVGFHMTVGMAELVEVYLKLQGFYSKDENKNQFQFAKEDDAEPDLSGNLKTIEPSEKAKDVVTSWLNSNFGETTNVEGDLEFEAYRFFTNFLFGDEAKTRLPRFKVNNLQRIDILKGFTFDIEFDDINGKLNTVLADSDNGHFLTNGKADFVKFITTVFNEGNIWITGMSKEYKDDDDVKLDLLFNTCQGKIIARTNTPAIKALYQANRSSDVANSKPTEESERQYIRDLAGWVNKHDYKQGVCFDLPKPTWAREVLESDKHVGLLVENACSDFTSNSYFQNVLDVAKASCDKTNIQFNYDPLNTGKPIASFMLAVHKHLHENGLLLSYIDQIRNSKVGLTPTFNGFIIGFYFFLPVSPYGDENYVANTMNTEKGFFWEPLTNKIYLVAAKRAMYDETPTPAIRLAFVTTRQQLDPSSTDVTYKHIGAINFDGTAVFNYASQAIVWEYPLLDKQRETN